MKKTIPALAICMILASSCQKAYQCTCTVTYDWNHEPTKETHYIGTYKKQEAKARCDNFSGYDLQRTYDCSLELRD